GKGADFHDLREPVARFCRAVVLLGRDAGLIAQALGNAVPLVRVATLDEAVRQAAELAREGDAVLLSPACRTASSSVATRTSGTALPSAWAISP
ncbi:glutamate ligase domain-containing protein, partial [Pseudomonas aeruginosa]|uniref:glutamate ligase domain-containing protein n=1 Tax=Pseudomonas aeruginosa TaxID=287 RepID=UPI003D811A7D|nr:hypothetical protein [Pseudomonas aeruginosa]